MENLNKQAQDKHSSISLKDFIDVLFPFLGKKNKPNKKDLARCRIYNTAIPKIVKSNTVYIIKGRDFFIWNIFLAILLSLSIYLFCTGDSNAKAFFFIIPIFFLAGLLCKIPTKYFDKMLGCYWEGKAASSLQELQKSSIEKFTYLSSIRALYIHYFEKKDTIRSSSHNSSQHIVPHYMINLILKDNSEINIYGFRYTKAEKVHQFVEDIANFIGVEIQLAPELKKILQATSSPKAPLSL